MIPILYSNTSNPKSLVTDTTTGLGRLDECISAVVTEERNGAYELEIEYPVNGVLFPQITCASWIKAKPFVDGDVQLFRVYSISKPVNGICTINAEHVSYMLTHALVLTGTDNTNPQSMLIADVFDTIENRASDIDPRYVYNGAWSFHFYCAKSASAQYFIMDKIRSIREWLLGSDYSILTVYGDGEYKFDNFDVYLYDADGGDHARGHDNGVKIQYGKNMLSLRMDESDDNVITLFYPYIIVYEDSNSSSQHNWFLKRDLKDYDPYLIDRYVANNHATGYTGMPRIMPLNLKDFEPWKDVTFGDYYSLPIDDQDLYECVYQYMDAHPECNSPKRSIDVSFVDLSSTDEYKNILPLQTINLCDIVTVEYPEWHINEKFKVVKTEYNVLEERYNKLTLGSLRNTLG